MPRIRAFPFHRASEDRVEILSWYQTDGVEHELLPAALPHWDPASPFRASVALAVAADGIAEDCDLSPDSVVRLAILWRSRGGTELRGRGAHLDIRCDRGIQEVRLHVEVPGKQLSGSIELAVTVTTTVGSRPMGPLAASRPGSVVWRSSRNVQLEGSASRFPMEWADFPASPMLPDRAAWFLSWDPDELDQSLAGSVRLYLNRSHPLLSQIAVGSARSSTEEIFYEALFFDVGRALITGALRSGEFMHDPEGYVSDSIGGTVRRLLNLHFPDEQISSLAGQLERDPARFDARLQERLGLFTRVS